MTPLDRIKAALANVPADVAHAVVGVTAGDVVAVAKTIPLPHDQVTNDLALGASRCTPRQKVYQLASDLRHLVSLVPAEPTPAGV